MNSLILLHNKYSLNTPKNNNNKDIMDLEGSNEKLNDSLEKDNEFDKTKINNSFYINNINNTPNNIFDLSYIKNKNRINNISDSKILIEKFFHSYKKATKRTHLDAFSKNKNEKNIYDKNNIVNLNINNNNYYYINNNVFNINSEEKYGHDFSKNKTLKEF